MSNTFTKILICFFLFVSFGFQLFGQTTDITISISSDYFCSEISWDITDANGVIISGVPYPDGYSTYETTVCVANGSYTFNWYDSYGDGWYDGIVQGSYTVKQGTSTLTSLNPSSGYSGSSAFSVSSSTPCTTTPCINVTLNMSDSYGDGWNGNTWTATSTTTGVVYGPYSIPTLPLGYAQYGSSGVASFCLPDDCYAIVCDYGSWQSEVSWQLVNNATGGIIASGGAPYSQSQIAVGSGSCSSPPPSSSSFCDDFESYTNGSWLAASSSDWTTWTSPYTASEDVQIINSLSNSPSNSIYFNGTSSPGGPSDVILPFGSTAPYTSGYFNFSAEFYVINGAYFNFQSEVATNIGWAFEAEMTTAGVINFTHWNGTSSSTLLSVNYASNQWFELKMEIDINLNVWAVFIDGVFQGSFVNPNNKIASLDLYPIAGNQFYVDDVCYEYSTTPISTYGCTDPIALNYNPSATIDDGSCIYTSGCGLDSTEMVITITTDDYPLETSWQLVDQNGGGWYINAGDLTIANHTYTWPICVPDTNCYQFTISDTYGDGLCGSCWGGTDGYYNVTYGGTTVASSTVANFGSSETTFNIGNCSFPPSSCPNNDIEVIITINTDDYPTETSWFLMDQYGGGWTNVPLTSSFANTTLVWTLCVPDTNCYTFTMLDSYGDGICCAWGSGSYNISYDGIVVGSGGSFAFAQEHCGIGYCTPNCQIVIPPTAISEGEPCGTDANHGCDDNWKISNFTIQGVTDDWSWGYLEVLGVPVGEGNPDLYVLMRKNNNFFYYSDYYLNTWYPNSFSMYAGISSPPLEIPIQGLFTSPYVQGQTFSYEFDVWDDDNGVPVTFYGNNDYIGSYTLPNPLTSGLNSITTSGGSDGNAYVDYTAVAPTTMYTPLTNNATIHGTFWAENNIRDTDWYDFTLSDSAEFILNSISETPFNVMLMDASGGCNNPLVIDSAFAYGCDTISIQQTLQAGSYWLLVMPTAYSCMNCTDSIDYLLDVNWTNVIPPCAISTSYTTNLVSCSNANSGAIDITVIGGTAPFTYNWSNGDTTEDITNLIAGNYTLTVIDNYGCSATSSVTLLSPDSPTISVSTQDIQCFGIDDGAIDITIVGGLPNYSFVWSNGATTEDISGLSAGTYLVNVTDSLGCTSTTTATISINTTAIILSFVVTDESTPNANDGAIDLTVTGGVAPYIYMWSIGAFTEDLSNLSAGIYYVAVLDSNGCVVSDSVVVSTTTTTIDVGIVDIVSPTSGCLLDSNESVTVAIKNFLITPATNFDIVFEFGGNTYTETVTSTLTTYQVLNYTFTPTVDLSVAGIYPLLTYISSVNDINNSNDTLLEDIHNYDHDFYTGDYSMSFEPFEDVSGWYMEDVNMDNVSWNISPGIGVNYSNGAFYNYNFDGVTPANDWILSQCFVLNSNVNYDISFKHRVASIVYPENMTVMLGTGQTGTGQTDTLITMQGMINTNFDSTGVTFSVPTNGIYFIGWHAESDPNMWRIDLDEINLGVSSATVIPGCTDSTAMNYNPLATVDDGSCLYCVYGCMDTTAMNYDSLATCTDSSCIPTIFGCMDSTALNYYSAATVDDSSCIYIVSGCTDSIAINYNPLANIDDSSCVYCVWGCMDSTAMQYNSLATCDDGSCVVCPYGCTDSTALNYDSTAVCDDGSCTYCVYGCTGPTYCNYDSTATCDDGSCWGFAACTDSLATNYNAIANCDDGSCIYSCTTPISGLFISDIIHDRATFNFDNMNTSSCIVDQLRIKYREVGTTTWSHKNMGSPTGYDPLTGICNSTQRTDKPARNLTPSTTYEWQMRVWYCSTGATAWVTGPSFTTADICPNVINFAASALTTTQTLFTWDTTAIYSFVRIKLRVDTNNATWLSAGGFGVNYPALSVLKSGLYPGVNYRGQARTWCSLSGGAYRSTSWTPLVFWTQPTVIRLEGENTAITNLEVYPNPSRDIFTITFVSEQIQDIEIRIVNVIGELLFNEKKERFIGNYTKQINLNKNTKGIYFLEIETTYGIVNKKLVLN